MESRSEPEPAPAWSPQDEALAGKYGADGRLLMLLPLSTGQWAIFDSGRELQGIIDPARFSKSDLLDILAGLSEACSGKAGREQEGAAGASQSAEELGL